MIKRQNRKKLAFSSKIKGFSKKVIATPSGILVTVFLLLSALSIFAYAATPSVSNLATDKISQTSTIYDRTGEHVLYELYGEENRKMVTHDEIPDVIRKTAIAAEDNNFYSHNGIDIKAIFRALKADVTSSEMQQGASTITQQLARNVFLTREKTFKRKVLEIILAFKIEHKFSKDQILDMYLNAVPYGSNAYGVEAASKIFFGKSAKDLTLDEAAFLSSMTNATTFYSPYGNHTDELVARQKRILEKTRELGLITQEEFDQANSVNTLEKVIPLKKTILAPHFVFYIKDQLEKQYGHDFVEKGGLKIITSIDLNKQELAESIIEKEIPDLQRRYKASNAALTAIDPRTGEILAMVGSRDYFDTAVDGQVNVATSPRQPGSSFKPFAYAAAFENGYQPETLLYDIPTNFGPDGSGKDYEPKNYDASSHGIVSMRQALSNSLNVPAVKTLYLAGIKNTIDLAHRMGITTLQDENRYGLALVLGGGEVTLLDETSAFSAFANDGTRNSITPILKITNAQDDVIFEAKTQSEQVINSDIARKINSVLSDNSARSLVFGTGSKLNIPGYTVAAKTGTTQEFHDAWTVGYTPSIACGVWVGNNNNDAMVAGADGSYVAAPIWNDFMSEVLKQYPKETFTDYDRAYAKKAMPAGAPQIKYYNKNTGKELSDKKRADTNPDKIEVRVQFANYPGADALLFPESQQTNDPMILRWQESLKNPDAFSNNNDNKDNKDNKNN